MSYKKKYWKFFNHTLFLILILISISLVSTIDKLEIEKINLFDKFNKNLLKSSYFTWDSNLTLNVGEEPSSIFIGDVNNDGQNDIVTANHYDDTISILTWNLTSNNWTLFDTKPVGSGPSSIFIADANNDGENDIVVANSNSDNVSIYLWDIKVGDWQPEIKKSVGRDPKSIFIGDVNNDGENDIVTANYDDDDISIFTWNSTIETWNPEIKKSVGDKPNCLFIGDVNNDGQFDIIVTNEEVGGNISIYTWNVNESNWNPEIIITILTGHLISLFVGDANNDGHNDILIVDDNVIGIYILLWNVTEETWNEEIYKNIGNNPSSVYIGDANNDGQNDIVVANEWFGYDMVSILLWNYTAGDWNPLIQKPVGDNPSCVFIGDANNDGQNDIVCSNFESNDISILLWNSSKTSWASGLEKEVGSYPEIMRIEDINNDGYDDVITISEEDNYITYYLWNQSIRDWNPKSNLYIDYIWSLFAVGDVNNDGYNDIITTSVLEHANVSIYIWNKSLGNWNTKITKELWLSAPYYTINHLFIGDANNDGQNDIIASNGEDISLLLWNRTSTDWDPFFIIVSSHYAQSVSIEDANNDGYDDIISAYIPGAISIISWNSTEDNWNNQILLPTTFQPGFIDIDDANNDGQNDLIVSNGENISLLLWNGLLGDWDIAINKFVGSEIRTIDIGDANNDGQNDIICSHHLDNKLSILLWNTTQSNWNLPIDIIVGNYPRKILIRDVNSDGFNDLIVSNGEDDGYVTIILWHRINKPNLSIIFPNPSGRTVQFNWTDVDAPFYNIYRNTEYIESIKGLNPIATLSSIEYSEYIDISGNYSYVITATDGFTESLISNCESVYIDVDPPTWSNLSAPEVLINSEIEISIEVEDITGIKSVLIFIDATDFPAFPNNISMEKGIGNIYRYKFNVTIEGDREFRIYIEDDVGNIETVYGTFKANNASLNNNFPYDILTYLIIILSSIIIGSIVLISFRRQRKILKRIKQKEQLIEELKNNQNNITEGDIILSQTEQICLVHKGPIEGFNFICPNCKVSYCNKCYEAIMQLENLCWSCSLPLDPKKPTKPLNKDNDELDGVKKEKKKQDKYKKTF